MKIPKQSVRWLLVPIGLLWLWFFINHPFEGVSVLAGILFLITAWYLIFGSPRRDVDRKGKDRRFRRPPWA